MPVFRMPDELIVPDPRLADESGLLAVGGDLKPERVMLAYRNGIFPWFSDEQPILWWSPDPRMVLYPEELRIGRSLGKRIRSGRYRITFDQAFADVIDACRSVPRPGQEGTWITDDMMATYRQLHRQGHAHSVEAWEGDELVGGLYGIEVGRVFCGESMFAKASDASKVAFAAAVERLRDHGCVLVDCQVYTSHLERFGAREIDREDFLEVLWEQGELAMRPGVWDSR